MQSITLRDKINAITSGLIQQNPAITQQEINRIIYRSLLQQGHSFTDISKKMSGVTATMSTMISTSIPTSSPLYGCPTNDDGEVIDPITLTNTIPEDLLISYISDTTGKKVCFNMVTLYEYIRRSGKRVHPTTREQIPDAIVEAVMSNHKMNQIRFTIRDKDILVDVFISIGELIVEVIRTLSGSLLDNLIEYDVYVGNKSIYLVSLSSPLSDVESGDIRVAKFESDLVKSDALVNMFAFAKTFRGNDTFDTIYSYLGSYLKSVPVLRVPGGIDYNISPNSTVIDVMLTFYDYLGGYDKVRDINLVTGNGESLSGLGLGKLVVNVIPGEEIYHVPYTDNDQRFSVLMMIRIYCCNNNNRPLLNATYEDRSLDNITLDNAINTNMWNRVVRPTAIRYTVDELTQFLIGQIKSRFDATRT